LAPRAGLEPATCGLQRLRVGLSHHPRRDPLGCRALLGAYCLGCSPPSLCTFPPTSCPSAGLAQDSSRRTFPEFTRFSFTGFPVMLPFDSPSLYQLSYRGSNLILCGPSDALGLRIPGCRKPQFRLPNQRKIVYRDDIDLFVIGAEYSESIDLPTIRLTLATAVILRGRYRKNDRTTIQFAGLALDPRKPSVLLNNQVVPKVVTKRHQDFVTTLKQSRHYLRLGNISYRFAIPETLYRSVHCGIGGGQRGNPLGATFQRRTY